MIYKHVQCPNYVTKNPETGALQALQCKLCGAVIADTIERTLRYETTKSGQLVKVVQCQLTRLANYCEIKIAFSAKDVAGDLIPTRYAHVTNGCSKCLRMDLTPEVLAELHAADQEESPDGFTARERAMIPTHVAVLQVDQSGIV